MAISRMQEPQQIQRGLGSLDVPRQNYGLGKLVKKAVRGVKKLVKSPLGKAAIIGGLGMWGMGAGPLSGLKGAGWMRNMMGAKGAGKFLLGGPRVAGAGSGGVGGFFTKGLGRFLNPWSSGQFSGKHAFGLASAAALAAPFLMKGEEPEEEIEESWTSIPSSIADIRNQARAHYTNPSASTLSFMPRADFINKNFYAADGGRAGLMNGGEPGQEQIEQMLMAEFVKYKNQGGTLTFEQFVEAIMQAQQEGQGMEQPQEVAMAANGGRIGYAGGQLVRPSADGSRPGYAGPLDFFKNLKSGWDQIISGETQAYLGGDQEKINEFMAKDMWGVDGKADQETIEMIIDMNKRGIDIDTITSLTGVDNKVVTDIISILNMKADGGRIGAYNGGLMSEDEDEYSYNPQAAMRMYKRPGKQEGGIMETEVAEEMIDMGGKEKDYRETGGFVDLGRKERADDVPARLSKNEFVFTADAVRAAGGGDIDKGSEVMQNLMDNLEAGGEVSEESQGLEGAQAMYDQQQMLQSRMI